jgi:hypothetical protein
MSYQPYDYYKNPYPFYMNNFTSRINKSPLRKNNFNLNKILDKTQNGINTINKITPLIQELKPYVKKGKDLSKNLNKMFFKNNYQVKTNYYEEFVPKRNIQQPNKPFF